MKKLLLSTLLFAFANINAQDVSTDYAYAKAGIRISGMYVFIGCEPANPYDYAGDIKVNDFAWTKTSYFEKIVKKAKKKFPASNGIIYRQNNPKKAELIIFRGLEKTGGGFRVGDKVNAMYGSNSIKGEVIQINNAKGKLRVKYIEDGDESLRWFQFKNVTKQ